MRTARYPYHSLNSKIKFSVLLLAGIFFFPGAYAQQDRVYATVTPSVERNAYDVVTGNPHPSQGSAVASVDNAAEALNTDENPATLNVKYMSPYYGEVGFQFKYAAPVATNSTTFIRIGNPQIGYPVDPADAAPLIGSLIRAEVYKNANAVSDGARLNASDVHVELVTSSNQIFLAVTASQAYNSVKIYLKYQASITGYNAGSGYSMSVYYAFYLKPAPADCGAVWASNVGERKSGSVSVKTALTNRENAIDTDNNTFSTLRTTNASGVEVLQSIFFNSASTFSNEQIKVILSIPAAVLTASIFDRITFQGYLGTQAVGSVYTLRSLLVGNPVVECSGDAQVTVMFTPGGIFDRVKVSVNSYSGEQTTVRVHHVSRLPAYPVFVNNLIRECEDINSPLQIQEAQVGMTYSWYDQNQAAIPATTNLLEYTPGALSVGTHTFYIRSVKDGCPATVSPFVKAEVTVYPKPGPPTVQLQ